MFMYKYNSKTAFNQATVVTANLGLFAMLVILKFNHHGASLSLINHHRCVLASVHSQWQCCPSITHAGDLNNSLWSLIYL